MSQHPTRSKALGAIAGVAAFPALLSSQNRWPNVLFLMTDHQRCEHTTGDTIGDYSRIAAPTYAMNHGWRMKLIPEGKGATWREDWL